MSIDGGTFGTVGSAVSKDAISIYSTGGSGFITGQAVVGEVIITLSSEL